MKLIAFLFISLCSFFSNNSFAQTCTLTVNITGLRSNNGVVYLSLYNSKDGYPKDHTKAFRFAVAAPANNKCCVLIDGIPKGVYAIACYDDENNDGKLDTNFLGMPKEGIGASNNAKGFMGPAKFCDAQFEVANNTTTEIKMDY